MKLKKILSLILLCTVLAGCSSKTPSPEIPSEPSNSPVSTLRTGLQRQGIRGDGNFEVTETGSYFMLINPKGERWLLYCDHGSDNFIKLCGRPDCKHTDSDCNARFDSVTNLCYYDGFLYTYNIFSGDLIRMNLDGTERTTVYNTSAFEASRGYKGGYCQKILNGVLLLGGIILDDNGSQITEDSYYKLDGSMDEPEVGIHSSLFLYSEGEQLVGLVGEDGENEKEPYVFGSWDPKTGVVSEFFKSDNYLDHFGGYIGTKAEYYFEDGYIIENSYTEGKKTLIDTGLKGSHQLACFPDCMIVYDCVMPEEAAQGVTKTGAALHFYSWDYESLGDVKINYQFKDVLLETGLICGETPERIILTDNVFYYPRYYINKSELGTGNIEIHSFNLPDDFDN